MRHDILHTDCFDLFPLLSDDSVALVLTDIPYGEVTRDSAGLRNFDKGAADVLTFDLDAFVDECVRVCRGSFYVFCGWEQITPLMRAFERHGLTKRLGFWRKTNPSPVNGQRLWLSGAEACVFARKPGATFNEHCKPAVWDCPSGRSKQHPTEKPLKLFERLLLASSNPGDLVLDPCAGSGTTGVAAKMHGRAFIGAEMDPTFAEVARQRIAA